ncbi:MAG: potassium/proton antiporter [bacterium]|nr:potassium/proton antiporter [bacterium]
MGHDPTALVLAATGTLLLVATLVSPVSQRLGVPALVLFIVLGMIAGSDGLGGIPFDDYAFAFRIGSIALVLILFDGGLNTPLAVLRGVVARAVSLATLGVVITAAVVAGAGILVGLPVPLAVLVGAVVSSTDAAAVFSVLRGSGVRLEERTNATVEVESGLNDPMAVVLTTVAARVVLGEAQLGVDTVLFVLQEFVVGVVGGLLFGGLGRLILPGATLPAAGLYPVVTVGLAFLAYGATTLVDGSGFLAVYVAAIVIGAGPLPYRAGVRRVHDGLAWLAQLSMFLLLGLLVSPSRLWPLADEGLILGLTLAFVARPLAVLVSLAPFPTPWRERGFIAWVGLRGAVPIVLAIYPVLGGAHRGEEIFHLVFFIVLVSSLIPGATVSLVARRLGLTMGGPESPTATVELVSHRDYRGEFVWFHVDAASAVAGAPVRDLPIPEACVLVLVLRGDRVIAPRGDTELRAGDHVCVFVTPEHRTLLDLLFGREV